MATPSIAGAVTGLPIEAEAAQRHAAVVRMVHMAIGILGRDLDVEWLTDADSGRGLGRDDELARHPVGGQVGDEQDLRPGCPAR